MKVELIECKEYQIPKPRQVHTSAATVVVLPEAEDLDIKKKKI